MKKVCLSIIFIVSICQIVQSQNREESYFIELRPSFHNGLTIEIAKDTSQVLSLCVTQENRLVLSYRKTAKNGQEFTYIKYANSDPVLDSVVKNRFEVTRKLSWKEENIWQRLLIDIDSCLMDTFHNSSNGFDGFSYAVFHVVSGDTIFENSWWMPPKGSKAYDILFLIFFELEKHESYLIESAITEYRRYFEPPRLFSVVSYDPVYVRLLDSPPKNCIEIYSQFVSTLPSSESVYLDITHYHGYDTQCIVDEFKKKYEIIYWVYDPSSDDDIKFKKLWGW